MAFGKRSEWTIAYFDTALVLRNELYALIAQHAATLNVILGEILVKAFEQIGRGDEWKIEKGRPGRRPKLRIA